MVFKVVSVEDEPEIAELLRIVLGNPEIEMHTADNGRDGLALVRSLKPDLVVLDVMMPGGMNGWDIYDAIRTSPDMYKIPIIMLSVLREKAERRQAFAGSEIDLYMTKPFDTIRLRQEVERMLGKGGLWQIPRQSSKPPVELSAEAGGPAAVSAPPPAPVQESAAPKTVPEVVAVIPAPPAALFPAAPTPERRADVPESGTTAVVPVSEAENKPTTAGDGQAASGSDDKKDG